jgi:hypothetical protein
MPRNIDHDFGYQKQARISAQFARWCRLLAGFPEDAPHGLMHTMHVKPIVLGEPNLRRKNLLFAPMAWHMLKVMAQFSGMSPAQVVHLALTTLMEAWNAKLCASAGGRKIVIRYPGKESDFGLLPTYEALVKRKRDEWKRDDLHHAKEEWYTSGLVSGRELTRSATEDDIKRYIEELARLQEENDGRE